MENGELLVQDEWMYGLLLDVYVLKAGCARNGTE